MEYRIEYYHEGRHLGSTPVVGTFKEATEKARNGVKRHPPADFVRLVEVGGSGAEVWSERFERHER